MNAELLALKRQIDAIKKQLAGLADFRPGTLSQQYNVCGTPNCRCKANPPQRHGPYYQLSWTRNKKSKTRFVRTPDLPRVRQELRNYDQLQALIEQWIDLSIQASDLRVKETKKK
jgi:hypothetical protein